jgi:hypothetical protein
LGVASERLNGVKQSGSRTIREPTWYFQSKLLVSYDRKDNMATKECQDIPDRNLIRICYRGAAQFLSLKSEVETTNPGKGRLVHEKIGNAIISI